MREDGEDLHKVLDGELLRLHKENPHVIKALDQAGGLYLRWSKDQNDGNLGAYYAWDEPPLIEVQERALKNYTPEKAANTLRHELGHAIDYLPSHQPKKKRSRADDFVVLFEDKRFSDDPRFAEVMKLSKKQGWNMVTKLLQQADNAAEDHSRKTHLERSAKELRSFLGDTEYLFTPRELFADACAIILRPASQERAAADSRQRVLTSYFSEIVDVTETILREQGLL